MRNRRSGHPLLGLIAYALVRGERRRKAEDHFRRAGFEVLKGVRELALPKRTEEVPHPQRKRIDIE
ncbi:hypothetical protein E0L93_08300 [Rubrobacter taiwanensis]|jgi:hypothetical protein|uniref:Uncharacterized protein n=1 Tax=Rubrobacter taiwanensis TaxID=185139 RepID=A0A4R1BHL1_9ACTN|nr:hypothetical protein [Rubrobacter taiwanensis]TCJ16723.1 hypothetical protein E0L93_08300 [Rubrobacter taiwanensis]